MQLSELTVEAVEQHSSLLRVDDLDNRPSHKIGSALFESRGVSDQGILGAMASEGSQGSGLKIRFQPRQAGDGTDGNAEKDQSNALETCPAQQSPTRGLLTKPTPPEAAQSLEANQSWSADHSNQPLRPGMLEEAAISSMALRLDGKALAKAVEARLSAVISSFSSRPADPWSGRASCRG